MRSTLFKPNPYLLSPIFEATQSGKLAEVLHCLDNAVGVLEAQDIFKNTPLIIAVQHKRVAIAKLLLDRNANIQVQNDDKTPLIYYAIQNNDDEMVRLLIEHGADPNQSKSKGGWLTSVHDNDTPLTFAIRTNALAVIETLINSGAAVNPHTTPSPLHLASKGSSEKVVELLLSNGADINALDDESETALHNSVVWDHTTITEILLKHNAKSDGRNKYGKAPIHYARSKKMLVLLLDYGCDINLPRGPSQYSAHAVDQFKTILHLSIHNKELVEVLLVRGAMVEARDLYGNTALHLACQFYEPAIFLLFVKNYKHLFTSKNNEGHIPLMSFICSYHINDKNGQLLLDQEQDFSLTDNNGNTALHLAVKDSLATTEFIHLLINKARGSLNQKNKQGDTPLHVAMVKEKGVEALLSEGADINILNDKLNTPMQERLETAYGKFVLPEVDELAAKLLPDTRSPQHANKEGKTLLHGLAFSGCDKAIKLLLTLHPDYKVDAVCREGKTAAFYALAYGHLNAFEILIQHGANVRLIKSLIDQSKLPEDNEIGMARCKLRLCYPDSDVDKQQAIYLAMTAIAFSRWSQEWLDDLTGYEASIQHLINKFGANNFTIACKDIFIRDLHAMDLTNTEEHGPHTDIDPYNVEYMRVAKFIIAEKYKLYRSMRDFGYYVNIKTLFGDLGFWKIIKREHPAIYTDLLTAIRSWPEEINSTSMYHRQKFNPLTLFREIFTEAYDFVKSDLLMDDRLNHHFRKGCTH